MSQREELAGLRGKLEYWRDMPRLDLTAFMLAIASLMALLSVEIVGRGWLSLLLGAALIIILAIWLHVCRGRRLRSEEQELHERLCGSGLLEALAMADRQLPRVTDWIPLPLRLLFPQQLRRSTALSSRLTLVANNLDWYLQPPRPLVRLSWILYPIICALLLISFNTSSQSQASPAAFGSIEHALGLFFNQLNMVAVYALMAVTVADIPSETSRRRVFAAELLKRMDFPPPILSPAKRMELGLHAKSLVAPLEARD